MEQKESPPMSPKKQKSRGVRTESVGDPETTAKRPTVDFYSLRSPKTREKKVTLSKAVYHLINKFGN
jgi:hypothetical protein